MSVDEKNRRANITILHSVRGERLEFVRELSAEDLAWQEATKHRIEAGRDVHY